MSQFRRWRLLGYLRQSARRTRRLGVGLLGTRTVRDVDGISPYGRLSSSVKVVLPGQLDVLDQLLEGLKLTGRPTPELQQDYETLLAGMDVDAVALACTELPLLVIPDQTTALVVDVTDLLAHALAGAALGT